MNEILWIILLIIFFALMIGLLFIYKYNQTERLTIIPVIRKGSLPFKILLLVMILYTLSIPVQLVILNSYTAKLEFETSSKYYDLIDVGDGVVGVGFKHSSLREGDHTYNIGRAAITKYDYEGNIIWESLYHKTISRESIFYNVELTSTGNLLVTGNEGTYYDNLKQIAIIYNQNGEIIHEDFSSEFNHIKPLEDRILYFKNEAYIRTNETNSIMFLIKDLNGNIKTKQYEYLPKENKYNLEQNVNLVGKTENRVFINIVLKRDHRIVVEQHLLEFDLDLNLIKEHPFEEDRYITLIKEHRSNYYLLWFNEETRESFITETNHSMIQLSEKEIKGSTAFIEAKDILFTDDYNIYVVGYEYNLQKQTGFTDDYSGFIMKYNYPFSTGTYYLLGRGMGVDQAIIKNNQLYTVGRLNTHAAFYSISAYRKYNWQGFLAITDLQNFKTKTRDYL